jgi:hypothetical protein
MPDQLQHRALHGQRLVLRITSQSTLDLMILLTLFADVYKDALQTRSIRHVDSLLNLQFLLRNDFSMLDELHLRFGLPTLRERLSSMLPSVIAGDPGPD